MKTSTITSIIIALVLIIGALSFAGRDGTNATNVSNITLINNVSIENEIQVVEINAKGGYQPQVSLAKAGIPTVIRFNTKGTFDCSASVIIPNLKISKFLPPSGLTDVDLGKPDTGRLQGSCGMGMYPFEIDFQ